MVEGKREKEREAAVGCLSSIIFFIQQFVKVYNRFLRGKKRRK